MGTRAELIALLQDNPPAEAFKPYCYISKESDALTAYFSDDADYSKRLNDHVTLHLSLTTSEIVGCRIKGISGLIADLPNFIKVEHGGVQLSVITLAARSMDLPETPTAAPAWSRESPTASGKFTGPDFAFLLFRSPPPAFCRSFAICS